MAKFNAKSKKPKDQNLGKTSADDIKEAGTGKEQDKDFKGKSRFKSKRKFKEGHSRNNTNDPS